MASPFEGSAFEIPTQPDIGPVEKVEVLPGGEGEDILSAARTLHEETLRARRSGNGAWLARLLVSAGELRAIAGDFLRKAVHLALAKFVLELCAMVIDAIMSAIRKMVNRPLDITSPNVYYGNASPAASGGSPYPGGGRSPFDGGLFAVSGGGTSPW